MDIYVNDQLVHTQSGESAFDGFNTIKLDNPIQINTGDVFEVVVTKEYFPFSGYFNTYLPEGVSFFYNKTSGEWVDLKEEDIVACIKVYTVTSSVVADDLEKYYKNESQFTATIVDNYGTPLSNVTVNITVNGVTYQRTSNENGTINMNINLNPGNYILTVFSPVDNKSNIAYSNAVLFDYIGTIELGAIMVKRKVISIDEFYNQFGYRVENLMNNAAIKSHIKDNPNYYKALQYIVQRLIKADKLPADCGF